MRYLINPITHAITVFSICIILIFSSRGFTWEPIGTLPYGPFSNIIEAEGRIWVAGGGTIFGFDPDEGNAPATDTIFVYGMRRDLDYHDGRLYITTDRNGLFIYDITEHPFREIVHWLPPEDERLNSCTVIEDGIIVMTGMMADIYFLSANADSIVARWTSQAVNYFGSTTLMEDLLLLSRDTYGAEMMLMSVADPTNPESLAVYEFGDNVSEFLPVNDTLCYISMNLDGVYLFNISDPYAIGVLAYAPIMYPNSKASSMSFNGETLLVTHRGGRNQPEGGLAIYSTGLDSIRWYRWVGGDVGAPLHVGNDAWVLKEMEGIYSVNLEQPERPRINWLHRLPHQVEGVFVRDNLAYLAEGHGGLRIIDYSDPANPHEIGWCDNVGLMEDIWVDGDHAYVADGNGLLIYDISDPAQPDTVAHIIIEQLQTRWVEGVAVEDDILYAATHFKLAIVDVSDPDRPSPLGEVECTLLKDLAIRDGIAYMADNQFFRIIDCQTPREPVQIAQVQMLGGGAWDVALRDTLALVSDRAYGLHVISIADPENPEIVGTLEFDRCQGLDDDGYFTYLGLVWDGIAAIDISDPENPEIVEYFDTPGGVLNVKSDGEIVVAADYNCGTSYFPRPDLQSIGNPMLMLSPDAISITVSPNPFNAFLNISYNLSNPGWMNLRIFGSNGREMDALYSGWSTSGEHKLIWNTPDLPAGMYLCILETNHTTVSRKILLLK